MCAHISHTVLNVNDWWIVQIENIILVFRVKRLRRTDHIHHVADKHPQQAKVALDSNPHWARPVLTCYTIKPGCLPLH